MKILQIFFAPLLIFVFAANLSPAITIIRDAEVEETLREMIVPIFDVAGIASRTPKAYIVNDSSINAFIIEDGHIFIHSGLILRFDNPVHLIAVLCHETGHMKAKHISRMLNKLCYSSRNISWATVVGLLGAAITKSEEVLALLIGYSAMEQNSVLKFSRTQELEADSLAALYLEKLGYDASALVDVFKIFQNIELLSGIARIPVYIMSHPKNHERILHISKHIKKMQYDVPSDLQKKYDRIKLKLKSYLIANNWLSKVPQDEYMKAIHLHRKGNSKECIVILEKLIAENPNDIYYKDTLAQTFQEIGQHQDAIMLYEKIYNNKLHPLIKIDYAKSLIASNKNLNFAIKMLESVKYTEKLNGEVFHLLATAYGKTNEKGMSLFMLAQEQMLNQNYIQAGSLLAESIKILDTKTRRIQIEKAKYLMELIEREMS